MTMIYIEQPLTDGEISVSDDCTVFPGFRGGLHKVALELNGGNSLRII